MSYINHMGIEYPDGYDDVSIQLLARNAQNRFEAMQKDVWGDFMGPEISGDMARMVLLQAEETAVRRDITLINELARHIRLTDLPEALVKQIVEYTSK